MHNLGSLYNMFDRHFDALAVREKTLEFRRLHLPDNDPDIGDGARSTHVNFAAV